MGVALDGDEFPVRRAHINVVSEAFAYLAQVGASLSRPRKESADDDAVLVSTRRSGRTGYAGGC